MTYGYKRIERFLHKVRMYINYYMFSLFVLIKLQKNLLGSDVVITILNLLGSHWTLMVGFLCNKYLHAHNMPLSLWISRTRYWSFLIQCKDGMVPGKVT